LLANRLVAFLVLVLAFPCNACPSSPLPKLLPCCRRGWSCRGARTAGLEIHPTIRARSIPNSAICLMRLLKRTDRSRCNAWVAQYSIFDASSGPMARQVRVGCPWNTDLTNAAEISAPTPSLTRRVAGRPSAERLTTSAPAGKPESKTPRGVHLSIWHSGKSACSCRTLSSVTFVPDR
jgi:hypothetical protein